ncbi:MAG: oligoribonuclease, partial [Ectothiorhodospira sp.]
MNPNPENLVWIDLEMTGLDPQADYILEIATLVTDKELNVLAEGPVIAIRQNEEILGRMDDWNHSTHSHSGLIKRVR